MAAGGLTALVGNFFANAQQLPETTEIVHDLHITLHSTPSEILQPEEDMQQSNVSDIAFPEASPILLEAPHFSIERATSSDSVSVGAKKRASAQDRGADANANISLDRVQKYINFLIF